MKEELIQVAFLRGKKTILRPLKEEDAPRLLKWINDPEIRPFILNSLPKQIKDELEFIEKARKCDSQVILGIEFENDLIGTMGLHGINWINRTATTGAIIGEKIHQSKGLGTDAKIALLDYAFNTLGLRKISSAVIAGNDRSQKYSEKCGYKIEGVLKEHIFKNGKYCDETILAVFKEDFELAKSKLGY